MISERIFLDAAGLLALERVEKEETERQYQNLLQSASNSEQVRILTDLVEKRRLENRALIEEEQLQRIAVEDSRNPAVTYAHQHLTPTKYRRSLGGPTLRSSLGSTTPVQRSSHDKKQLEELGQLESILIQANISNEDRISVDQFDDHTRMSTVIQKIKFVVEQLSDSMVTNLINSVFLSGQGMK